jgi:hypothetical protein
VSKGAKHYHQKQQYHTCDVSKGAKQDHQKQYVIVVFGGTV